MKIIVVKMCLSCIFIDPSNLNAGKTLTESTCKYKHWYQQSEKALTEVSYLPCHVITVAKQR